MPTPTSTRDQSNTAEEVGHANTDSPEKPEAAWIGRTWGWIVRWSRRLARLAVVAVAAGLTQVVGLPWVIASLVGTAVGFWLMIRGPLRSPRSLLLRSYPRLALIAAVFLTLSTTAWSYTGYLTDEGAASFDVRTADWMRDHGLSPVVDQIELRLYGKHEPSNDPVALDQLPEVAATNASFPGQGPLPPNAPDPIDGLLDAELPGEGLWTANDRSVDGSPVSYTTFLRPDPDHLNVVAAAVWMDPTSTTLVYAPGTKEPEGGGWAWGSGIPQSERAGLVAAFNSGFKFKDIPGGVYTEGQEIVPLVEGQGSLVIYADGSVDVGAWGTDVVMTPEVVSVRQNLELVVDNGEANPGLASSIQGEWGKRLWQLQYTRRSGIGITVDGALVYVAGSRLTTESLANALVQAGAVRAMQLDIHSKHPTFNFFEPDANNSAGVAGTKLLPDMRRDPDRYLAADQRDFFALVLR